MSRLGFAVVAVISVLSFSAEIPAFSFFPDQIPNGAINRCANCHVNPGGGGARSAFGLAFASAEFTWTAALASAESDGDGVSNGVELQDPEGIWEPGFPQPGDPLLVSSPGWGFSTPGERGIALSEVLLEPASGEAPSQVVELLNLLPTPVDAAGLWLHTGSDASPDEFFEIPLGQPANTTIPGDGVLQVVVNGPSPNTPGVIAEPTTPDPGSPDITLLAPSDFMALHWIADEPRTFDLSWTMVDFVQWGTDGQDREFTAAGAGQWEVGTAVPTPPPGTSLEYLGAGDTADDWISGSAPTLGEPGIDALIAATLRTLLGERASSEATDANMDDRVDSADVVTRVLEKLP